MGWEPKQDLPAFIAIEDPRVLLIRFQQLDERVLPAAFRGAAFSVAYPYLNSPDSVPIKIEPA